MVALGEKAMKFQNIQTKRKGLRCQIQVTNHSGHDVLTTYEPGVDNSVEVAQADLAAFWDDCIAEFSRGGRTGLKPLVAGTKPGESEAILVDPKAPDFDLSLFENITVMPFPLAGG
jgi:hypothetical protein